MERRFQARFNDTGEPIGVPMPKATDAVKCLRKMGFPISRCTVEMWIKVDGDWKKDVSCPAQVTMTLLSLPQT